jgi:hypothetical protein
MLGLDTALAATGSCRFALDFKLSDNVLHANSPRSYFLLLHRINAAVR